MPHIHSMRRTERIRGAYVVWRIYQMVYVYADVTVIYDANGQATNNIIVARFV